MSQNRTVLVLDSSAFIMGYDPLTVTKEQFTVPAVLDELHPQSMIFIRLRLAIERNRLRLKAPSPRFLEKIDVLSAKTGDLSSLSHADRQLLALSLEIKENGYSPMIVTDDYSVQNVADRLGIEYRSLSAFGIRYRFQWVYYCPACRRKYPKKPTQEICRVCGTKLKRRVSGKIPVKRESKPDDKKL
jgi:UPF0271 protein